MIWLLVLVIIFLISFFLAWASLRDFHEFPKSSHDYASFWIQNPPALTPELIDKIHALSLEKEYIVSFEKIWRKDSEALVIYAPRALINQIPQLSPIEIEEYPAKININQTQTLELSPKSNQSLELNLPQHLSGFLKLVADEGFLWQVTARPHQDSQHSFQVTIRTGVAAKEPKRRVDMIKILTDKLSEYTSLTKHQKKKSSLAVYELYKKRGFKPKEVGKFLVPSNLFLRLVSV